MKSIAGLPAPLQAQLGGKNLQQTDAFHHERFLHVVEKLEAGLTIQTREGDVVSLSSGSFAELTSSEYNSRGIVQTRDSAARVSHHQREVSLYTRESFSFTVAGDLNDQELADIDAIIQGIDAIIGQMAAGDMEGAVSQAMDMEGFASISMYTADISLEQRYAYQETVQSRQSVTDVPSHSRSAPSRHLPAAEASASFTDKMARFMEKQNEMLAVKSAPGLDKLFRHHQKNFEKLDQAQGPLSLVLENARKQMDQLIAEMVKTSFKGQMDQTA